MGTEALRLSDLPEVTRLQSTELGSQQCLGLRPRAPAGTTAGAPGGRAARQLPSLACVTVRFTGQVPVLQDREGKGAGGEDTGSVQGAEQGAL